MERSGGLARRATLIEELRASNPDAVLVDTGGIFPRNGLNLRMRADVALDAMALMKYDAVNMDTGLFMFGLETFEQRRAATAIPFVSSNLVFKDNGRPYGERYVLQKAGGATIAIVGVMEEHALENVANPRPLRHLKVLPPVEALKPLVTELQGRADIIVLLSRLSLEETESLVAEIPQIAMAFCGRPKTKDNHGDGCGPSETHEILKDRVLPVNFLGAKLGRAILTLSADGRVLDQRTERIPIDQTLEQNPRIEALKEEAYNLESKRMHKERQERAREKINKDFQEKYRDMNPMEFINQMNKSGGAQQPAQPPKTE